MAFDIETTRLISIHAPRTGSDIHPMQLDVHPHISIHAPRTGSDSVDFCKNYKFSNFNPRSPHGERHGIASLYDGSEVFQSTLPARGATPFTDCIKRYYTFQSTLPARGATLVILWSGGALIFQSTLPARGATFGSPGKRMLLFGFQSTLPARGATCSAPDSCTPASYFNPRSPHGERQSSMA